MTPKEMNISELATKLMKEHRLIDKGWTFEFDNALRRNGACDYGMKIISLSKHYVRLNNRKLITDTILHEIAHALTPDDRGHGRSWKLKCAEIGAMPVAVKKGMGIKQVEGKWKANCPGCNRLFTRHRRVIAGYRYSCPDCSGTRFNVEYQLIFKRTA